MGVAAILGFAANSLLARHAIGAGGVDAATYTVVRLASGAAMLLVLSRGPAWRAATWGGGLALFTYAAAFSWSYVRIGAALGALVLFPTVKVVLLGWGFARGQRPPRRELAGGALALAGLVLLTVPRAGRADPAGVALMALAGAAWAVYTVAGVRSVNATAATTSNFIRAALVSAFLLPWTHPAGATPGGLALAVVSGAVTSALAYVLWYATIPRLTATQMGIAQLAVPGLAMVGAVALLGEQLTAGMAVAAACIFTGVGIALLRR